MVTHLLMHLLHSSSEIMLDALPTLGRSDVLPLLKRLINENIASPARAAFMANLMALTAEPAPRLITGILVNLSFL